MCGLDISQGGPPVEPPPRRDQVVDMRWSAIRRNWQAAARTTWRHWMEDLAGNPYGGKTEPRLIPIASRESLDRAREEAEKRLADLQHAARGTWFK